MSTVHIVNCHREPAETIWHSAILEPRLTDMQVGPAVGSQEGPTVAHFIIDTGGRFHRNGYTVTDPAVLDELATGFRLLADTLRREQTEVGQ